MGQDPRWVKSTGPEPIIRQIRNSCLEGLGEKEIGLPRVSPSLYIFFFKLNELTIIYQELIDKNIHQLAKMLSHKTVVQSDGGS